MKKYHICGRKNGCKEFLKTVLGTPEAEEEVERLNNISDGITYHKELIKDTQTHRVY